MNIVVKRILAAILACALAVVLAVVGFIVWAGTTKQAVPGPEAMAALAEVSILTGSLEVEAGPLWQTAQVSLDWITFLGISS